MCCFSPSLHIYKNTHVGKKGTTSPFCMINGGGGVCAVSVADLNDAAETPETS